MANIKLIMCIVFKSPLLYRTEHQELVISTCHNFFHLHTSVTITVPSVYNLYLLVLMQLVYQKLFIKLLGNLPSDPTSCVVLLGPIVKFHMLFITVYNMWGSETQKMKSLC